MSIEKNYSEVLKSIPKEVTLIAVSKTKPKESIESVYDLGHRDFGENKVQELKEKAEALPQDIKWHLIGHLQTNKVKYIAPFVHLVHAVDSEKLLKEINKQALKNNRIIHCLLQVKIAQEDSKFGISPDDLESMYDFAQSLENVKVVGLMGMSTNTDEKAQIAQEFSSLKELYTEFKQKDKNFTHLSMGMSGDYPIAIENGSNMVRIGSSIFGKRDYQKI